VAKRKLAKKSNVKKNRPSPAKPIRNRSEMVFDLANIKELASVLIKNNVSEIEWKKGQESLRLRIGGASNPVQFDRQIETEMNAYITSGVATEKKSSNDAKTSVDSSRLKEVCSPLVGTFYEAASPGADAYVREGQEITKGAVLCIVEAMKLMNEIESEFSGKIVSVLVENGQPVEYGEPLYLVEV